MPSKTQSILIGGLVVGLLSTSVLGFINALCCAGVLVGAMTGVWHYVTTHKLTIPAGQGVLIGVLAGVLGAVIASVLNYLLVLAGLDLTTELTVRVFERLNFPQENIDMMRQQAANQSFTSMLATTGMNVVLYAIMGAIGGAIGASVFKRGGDTPGGGPAGDGPGGPRAPEGDRPRPSGPEARSTPPESGAGERDEASYRPASREEPTVREEPATREA